MGSGGGFLAGFSQGIGNAANQAMQSYVDMQGRKYDSMSKIWEAMANDPNYAPEVKQKFMQNAMTLQGGRNLFDQNARKAADTVAKLSPSEEAQRAHDAQSMLGVDPSKFYNSQGYMGPEQQLNFATEKALAPVRAQFSMMGTMGGQQPTDPNDLDARTSYVSKVHQLMPHLPPVLTQPVPGGITYTDDNGQQQIGKAGIFQRDVLGSAYYVQTPQGWRKVNPDSTLTPRIERSQNSQGGMEWAQISPTPSVAPNFTGVAAPPIRLGTEGTQSTDALNLTQHHTNQGIFTPQVTVGGQASPNAPGPAISKANAATALGQPPSQIVPQRGSGKARGASKVSSPPTGAWTPPAAVVKGSLSEADQADERNSEDTFRMVSNIADIPKKYGLNNQMAGKFFGRFIDLANHAGWAGIINKVSQAVGLPNAAQAKDDLAVQNGQQLASDTNNADLQKLYNEFGIAPQDRQKYATAAAETLTLMRNLAAFDVKLMGAGRGITQLFAAMQPYLISSKQDPALEMGHAIGLTDVAADKLRTVYLRRYGSNVAPYLSPDAQKMLQRFNKYDYVSTGVEKYDKQAAQPSGLPPTIQGKSGLYKGQTLYLDTADGQYYPTQHKH